VAVEEDTSDEDSPVKEFTQDSSQGHSDSSFYEEEEEKKSSDKEKEIIFANIAKTRSRVDDKQEELLWPRLAYL
jgi:hypothetical protein